MHDRDREKASSLVTNLKINENLRVHNPYFNKNFEEDSDIEYLPNDLISFGQMP